jgi:hypothetical protein
MSKRPSRREAREAAWRLAFRPHAIIATDSSIPSPIFVAALIGVENILRIDFDLSQPEETYVHQALAKYTGFWQANRRDDKLRSEPCNSIRPGREALRSAHGGGSLREGVFVNSTK